MKNLKRFVAMLMMATLFTTSFTSCIESDVSDAVDAVYLAQAEYLAAQAALKEAEAQWALADAAYREALAAVQNAEAARIDAYTAGIIIANEGTAALNAHTAAMNLLALEKAQAAADVYLEQQMALLIAAQQAHQIALVNLGAAVQAAEDAILLDLFDKYEIVSGELTTLQQERLIKELELAKKELMLVPAAGGGQVTMAYLQAMLEADLVESEADLVAAQAALAAAQAITSEDASDAQKWVTDLTEQIDAVEETIAQLNVDKAAADIVTAETLRLWNEASAEYSELTGLMNQVSALKASIKGMEEAIDNEEEKIAAAEANILAIPAAEAALAAVDTTTAYQGVLDAMQDIKDAEDLVGDNYVGTPADEPSFGDAPKVVATAWDEVWNAELAAIEAQAAYDSVAKYTDPSILMGPPFLVVNEYELALVQAINAVNPSLPGNITTAQGIYDAALLEEIAAQDAFNNDPSGSTFTDGDDTDVGGPTKWDNDFVGDHTDVPLTSYKQVATWTEIPAASDQWYPATYDAAATIPAIPVSGAITYSEFDATAPITAADVGDANKIYYVEVEADDSAELNMWRLWYARLDAQIAEDNLNFLLGNQNSEIKDIADAQALLDLAYMALGYTPPSLGEPLLSDWNAALDLRTEKEGDRDDAMDAIGYPTTTGGMMITSPYSSAEMATAYYNVVTAEAAHAAAVAALGTDFRPAADSNSWTTLFDQWYDLPMTGEEVMAYTSSTYYQRLQDQIGPVVPDDIVDEDTLPHVAAGTYVPTAYEELRNAYFQVVWAMEDLAALGTEASNNADIATAEGVIEDLEADLVAHNYALVELEAQLAALAADFGFDEDLFDDAHNPTFGYLPIYFDYLDALAAAGDIQADIDAQGDLKGDLESLRTAVINNLTDGTITDVDKFMKDIANVIYGDGVFTFGLMGDIADLELTIEKEKALIANGMVNMEDAQAWIEECERQLEVLNTKIALVESAASTLLDRINALLG